MLIHRFRSRSAQLFRNIDRRNGVGLEIGALDKPSTLRSEGKVYYADYRSTEGLRSDHQNTPSVNCDKIVEVDFVTNGGPVSAVVPPDLRFDYVIASHVIEHVPDIISWLQDIANVLKPRGILSLIIPNKKATFDVRRSLSEQKDFLAAYIQRQNKPSPLQVFDFYRWHERDGKLVHTLEQSMEMAKKAMTEYVDCHCWVFTERSFRDEMEFLVSAGLIPMKLDFVTRTRLGEIDMFAQFSKD